MIPKIQKIESISKIHANYSTRPSDIPGYTDIVADFFVPAINARKKPGKNAKPEEIKIGELTATFNPKTSEVFWRNYNPFRRAVIDPRLSYVLKEKNPVVEDLFEYVVLKKIKRQFPQVKIVRHEADTTSIQRKVQIRKRLPGLKRNMHYGFDENLQALKRKIALDTRKGRGLKPLKFARNLR